MMIGPNYSLSTLLGDSPKELGLTGHERFLSKDNDHEIKQLRLNLAYIRRKDDSRGDVMPLSPSLSSLQNETQDVVTMMLMPLKACYQSTWVWISLKS
jgi:hypothetical protein